jgi:hypothetical protein
MWTPLARGLQLVSQLPLWVRQNYCSDSYVYLAAARRINSNILLVVNDSDNNLVFRQLFTPKDCPAWPNPPAVDASSQ